MTIERSLIWIASDHPQIGKALAQRLLHACGSLRSQGVAKQSDQPLIDVLWVGDSLNIDANKQLAAELPKSDRASNIKLQYVEQGNAVRYLGTENRFIVFNALEKFDVNAFAAICGTLVHSGILYLLSRSSSTWRVSGASGFSEFQTTASEQSQQGSDNPFIDRFTRILSENTQPLTSSSQHNGIEGVSIRQLKTREIQASHFANAAIHYPETYASQNTPTCVTPTSTTPNPGQQQLIKQLKEQLATGQSFVSVITADRGRGKSAMLGLLLADLPVLTGNSQQPPIIITGPAQRAAAVVFKHFEAKLATAHGYEKPSSRTRKRTPIFQAPDILLSTKTESDTLIIDEAAALPLPILKKLLKKFPKVILATTVHGYEGAGRGFAIRLRKWLESGQFSSHWLGLEQPVRWLQGDPLELLCDQIFHFKATLPAAPAAFENTACKLHCATPQELIGNEKLLGHCFALLLQAHYQTRPLDLYHLLSGDNLKLYLLNYNSVPVALALLATEGPFNNPSLRRDIVARKRRPRGHVLPQLLAQWIARDAVLEHRIGRVVRIAVHPHLHRRGLGSQLLQSIHTQLEDDTIKPVAATGTLYGADSDLIAFWESNGYSAFHLGARKNNRSGERSIAMLRPLKNTTPTMHQFLQRAVALLRINFRNDPAIMHTDTHTIGNSSTDTVSLSYQNTTLEDVSQNDNNLDYLEFVRAYACGERSFHDTRTIILDYLSRSGNLIANTQLDSTETDILNAIHNAEFSFTTYAKGQLSGGKKASEILLRSALKKLTQEKFTQD